MIEIWKLSITKKFDKTRKECFATNSNFLIPIFLRTDDANL